MGLVDIEIVSRQLARIKNYLNDLVNHGNVDSIGRDLVKERFMEFTLQQIIQLIIDIGNHMISDEKWEEPKSNREIFEILKIHGVISSGLSDNLKEIVGFRNILVHEYVELDKDIEREIYRKGLSFVEKFIKEISTFLSNLKGNSFNL